MSIKFMIIAALIAAIIIGGGAWLTKFHHDAVQQGIQEQKTADLTRATELVHERDQLKKQDRTATTADICRRLGGVPDKVTGECN